jgi:hypothetical protein
MRTRIIVASATAAASLALGASGPAVAAPAKEHLRCHASMSNAQPQDYATTDVLVRTNHHAHVKTVAHYKTKNTTHYRKASKHGKATVPYYISGATPGYKVTVSVSVKKNGLTGSCSTSFTPQS